jgi:hypothetical protein
MRRVRHLERGFFQRQPKYFQRIQPAYGRTQQELPEIRIGDGRLGSASHAIPVFRLVSQKKQRPCASLALILWLPVKYVLQ